MKFIQRRRHPWQNHAMPDHLGDGLISRYLRLLGLPQQPPSLEALTAIVSAHLTRIPFENISKLYRRKRFCLAALPDIESYLDGIEHYHFGGTCYANNYYLYSLLEALGYEVRLCGADMGRRDAHLTIIATVNGREYLVDAGNAAPFLEPMPRDLKSDYVVRLGWDTYILKPQDADGCSTMELHREGIQKYQFTAKPHARRIEEFSTVIAESMDPKALFMNAVLMTRFWTDRRGVAIHNTTVITAAGDEYETQVLASRDDLIAEIERRFEIPADIVREALSEIPELKNAWE